MAQVTAPTLPHPKNPTITHLAVLNEDNQPVVVMCLRVKARSINPDPETWSQARPTCPVCARKWDETR